MSLKLVHFGNTLAAVFHNKLQTAPVQLLEQGQDCAQYVLIASVAFLIWSARFLYDFVVLSLHLCAELQRLHLQHVQLFLHFLQALNLVVTLS